MSDILAAIGTFLIGAFVVLILAAIGGLFLTILILPVWNWIVVAAFASAASISFLQAWAAGFVLTLLAIILK